MSVARHSDGGAGVTRYRFLVHIETSNVARGVGRPRVHKPPGAVMDAHHRRSLLDGDIDVDGDVNVAVVLDADGLDADDGLNFRQGGEELLRRRVVA